MTFEHRLLQAIIHAAAAGAFFFALQRYGLAQELGISIALAAFFAAAAAALSWHQTGK